MSRTLLFAGLVIGASITTVGCSGNSTDDPAAILGFFQKDATAASQKYQGKTVRLRVEKVSSVEKVGRSLEFVNVQGTFDKPTIMISATVTDAAEQQKALALKIGDSTILEGEVGGAMGEVRGMGVIFMKSA